MARQVLPPVFFHQMACYVVMADWQAALGLSAGLQADFNLTALPPVTKGVVCGAIVSFGAAMAFTTLLRPLEWFPFSEFGFYANPKGGGGRVLNQLTQSSRTGLASMLQKRMDLKPRLAPTRAPAASPRHHDAQLSA
jgi:hypothetical protein